MQLAPTGRSRKILLSAGLMAIIGFFVWVGIYGVA